LRDIKDVRLVKLIAFKKIGLRVPVTLVACVWLGLAAGIGIDLHCGVWITHVVNQVLFVEPQEDHRTYLEPLALLPFSFSCSFCFIIVN